MSPSALLQTLAGKGFTRVKTLVLGKSGTAGVLDIYPSTASKGKVEFVAADNADNTTVTLTIPASRTGVVSGSLVLTDLVTGVAQDVWTASATQNYPLGAEKVLPDGRKFRYAQAGASNITRALMQQTAVLDSKFLDITQTGHAQTAASTSITVLCTTGSALAANYFAGGKLIVTTGTNLGDTYNIKSSSLQATDTLLDLVLDEPLRNAIAATDKVSVVPNRWKKTVVVPTTTITSLPAGVPLIDVTAAFFYWAQVRGPAPLIVDTGDTVVVGSKVGIPATNAVAGTCGVATATAFAFPVYGTCQWIATAGEPAVVFLELE